MSDFAYYQCFLSAYSRIPVDWDDMENGIYFHIISLRFFYEKGWEECIYLINFKINQLETN